MNPHHLKRATPALLTLGIDPDLPAERLYSALSSTPAGNYASMLGSSHKCMMGESVGWLTAVSYQAAATESGIEGYTSCAFASPGCTATCIRTTGQMIYPTHTLCRIRRTARLFLFPELTARAFNGELLAHAGKAFARGLLPCFRLDGTSDHAFWRPSWGIDREVPGRAYDYTKRPLTPDAMAAIDSGWHLTFSLDEREQSLRRSLDWAAAGVNTALVVGGPPGTVRKTHKAVAAALVERGTFAGRPTLPGDEHDLRFLDPKVGGWVVLAAKGHKIKHDATGFVVRFDPEVLLGTDLPAERALWRTKDLERFTPTPRAIAAK
jgi:hypothetical protein